VRDGRAAAPRAGPRPPGGLPLPPRAGRTGTRGRARRHPGARQAPGSHPPPVTRIEA
jgi:hypothetical protein